MCGGLLDVGSPIVEAECWEQAFLDISGDGPRGTQARQPSQAHWVDLPPVLALESHVRAQRVRIAEGLHAVGAEEDTALWWVKKKGQRVKTAIFCWQELKCNDFLAIYIYIYL